MRTPSTARLSLFGSGMFLLLVLLAPMASVAQPTSGVNALVQQRVDAERAHLWRVAAWGGANVVGGLVLMLGADRETQQARRDFGMMSAGWGVVNVGIAAAGLLAGGDAGPVDYATALDDERFFHDVLLLNLGLNVAYSAVGGTMLAAGYRDVNNGARWRGFGSSLIMQGAGLLVLDGIAFLGSRARLGDLVGMAGDLSATALPTGIAFTLRF